MRQLGGRLVSILALALAAAACSGGDGADPPTTTATTTAPGSPSTTAADAGAALPTAADLEAFATDLLAATDAGAAIVAVQRGDGDPVVVTAGEVAGTGEPVEPSATIRVASITKSWVAAVAVQLHQEGTLDLDAPVGEWIDWPGGDVITVRNLLDHTSGIASFGNGLEEGPLFTELLLDTGRSYSVADIVEATRDLPSLAEPGATTRYNNLNYILAGAVVEAATGQPLGDVLADRLFAPLGMDDSWYPPSGPDGEQPLPGLWHALDGVDPQFTSDRPMTSWETLTHGAGAGVSSVADLFTWGRALLADGETAGTDLSSMIEIGAGGYGLGVIGLTDTGDCVFDGCPPGVTFTRTMLSGDIAGASTRLVYDPATDTLLLVFLDRNALSLDEPLLAFLDGLG